MFFPISSSVSTRVSDRVWSSGCWAAALEQVGPHGALWHQRLSVPAFLSRAHALCDLKGREALCSEGSFYTICMLIDSMLTCTLLLLTFTPKTWAICPPTLSWPGCVHFAPRTCVLGLLAAPGVYCIPQYLMSYSPPLQPCCCRLLWLCLHASPPDIISPLSQTLILRESTAFFNPF